MKNKISYLFFLLLGKIIYAGTSIDPGALMVKGDDVFDELKAIISMLNKSNSWSEFSNKLVSEEYNKNSVNASKVTEYLYPIMHD